MKRFLTAVFAGWLAVAAGLSQILYAADDTIKNIRVEGNAKVESDAILNLLSSKKGDPVRQEKIREDIHSLYDIGYFSDIRVFREAVADGTGLVIQVREKPAITKIEFKGMDEVKEEDITKSMETRLYTILNEGSIASDMRLIEKKYIEKGFYLALVTYSLQKKGKNDENNKI